MIFPLVKSITKPLKETIIGIRLSIYHLAIYLYFIVLCLCLLTIFVINPASFNFIESAMILSIVRRTYEFHLNSNDTGRS
ncbi:MAG TPA: hypothetical protein VJZ16_05970 [Syntrophales bacterium]|nr:hypothetical protein [Syntrophales bacterium]